MSLDCLFSEAQLNKVGYSRTPVVLVNNLKAYVNKEYKCGLLVRQVSNGKYEIISQYAVKSK